MSVFYKSLKGETDFDQVENITVNNLTVNDNLFVSGAVFDSLPCDNTTIQYTNSVLNVKNQGVSNGKILTPYITVSATSPITTSATMINLGSGFTVGMSGATAFNVVCGSSCVTWFPSAMSWGSTATIDVQNITNAKLQNSSISIGTATSALTMTGFPVSLGSSATISLTDPLPVNTITNLGANDITMTSSSASYNYSFLRNVAMNSKDITGAGVVSAGTLKCSVLQGNETILQDISVLTQSGNQLLYLDGTSSGVNYLTLNNSATATNLVIQASGNDSNVSLDLKPKGAGLVNIYGGSSATRGDLLISDGTKYIPFGIGTSGQVLKTDLSATNKLAWGTVDFSTYVVGPSSATADSLCIFSGTTGKLIKSNNVTLDSSNVLLGLSKVGQGSGANDNSVEFASGANMKLRVPAKLEVVNSTGIQLTDVGSRTIYDNNSNELLKLVSISSGVNSLMLTQATTGNYASIGVDSSDTNTGIRFDSKGTGGFEYKSDASSVKLLVGMSSTSVDSTVLATTGNVNYNVSPRADGYFIIGGRGFQPGSWTGVANSSGGGSNFNIYYNHCKYHTISTDFVWFSIEALWLSKTGVNAGEFHFSLPFTIGASSDTVSFTVGYLSGFTFGGQLNALGFAGSSYFVIYNSVSAGFPASMQIAGVAGLGGLAVSGFYSRI